MKHRISDSLLRSSAAPYWLSLVLAGCVGVATYLYGYADYHFTNHYLPGSDPAVQRIAVCLLFFLVAFGGSFLLLQRCRCSVVGAVALSVLCLAAMLIRVYYSEQVTQDYDYFLSAWVETFRQNGGFAALSQPIGDYNVPYLYFLAAFSYLPLSDLYLIKLLSICFDFLLAWGLVGAADHFRVGAPLRVVTAGLALLIPTTWLNSGWWAQCDSIYGSFLVLAFLYFLKGRGKLGLLFTAFAFAFKLQAVFFFPLVLAFWLAGRVRLRDAWAFPAAYIAMILPALIAGKPLRDILMVYVGQAGTYASRLTLNAPSIFQFAPDTAPHDPLFWGGIFAAGLFVCLTLLNCWEHREGLNDRVLLLLLLLFSAGIPLLLPSMHERYWTLAEAAVVLVAVVMPRRAFLLPMQMVASLSGYLAYLLLRFVIPMRLGTVLVMAITVACYLFFKTELWAETDLAAEQTKTPPSPEKGQRRKSPV